MSRLSKATLGFMLTAILAFIVFMGNVRELPVDTKITMISMIVLYAIAVIVFIYDDDK